MSKATVIHLAPGISNPKGTCCYINVSLLLLHQTPLVRYFMNICHIRYKDYDNDRFGEQFCYELYRLFLQLDSGDIIATADASDLYPVIQTWNEGEFIDTDEFGDAVDMLGLLLHHIKNFVSEYGSENMSLFDGECKRRLMLISSDHRAATVLESKDKSVSWKSILPISVWGTSSVEEALSNYVKIDDVKGYNWPAICPANNDDISVDFGSCTTRQQVIFNRIPCMMLLHLRRFEVSGEQIVRSSQEGCEDFRIPLSLDFHKILSCDNGNHDDGCASLHNLLCVILHSGNAINGHFTLFYRRLKETSCDYSTSSWLQVDDSRTVELCDSELKLKLLQQQHIKSESEPIPVLLLYVSNKFNSVQNYDGAQEAILNLNNYNKVERICRLSHHVLIPNQDIDACLRVITILAENSLLIEGGLNDDAEGDIYDLLMAFLLKTKGNWSIRVRISEFVSGKERKNLKPFISEKLLTRNPTRKIVLFIVDIKDELRCERLELVNKLMSSDLVGSDQLLLQRLSKRECIPLEKKCMIDPPSSDYDSDDDPMEIIGRRLAVKWKGDKFYKGFVTHFDEASKKHSIKYDDGEEKMYKLWKKTIRFI